MIDGISAQASLALVGLRGTGKSTIGRIVAERSKRLFLDADRELEAEASQSIAEIFATEGEESFRDQEQRVIARLCDRQGLVLATGGGAILRAANRSALRRFGVVVWLRTDPAVLADRIRSAPGGVAGRPPLTQAGTLAELGSVLSSRAHLYHEVADAEIQTGGKGLAQVADEVLRVWTQVLEAGSNAR